jgi:glyoxylase-like metal-dependent hydrolase (beta-lactamase superfamily II)
VSAWSGGEFGPGRCVLAPNAGPMTLDGTNTWILREDEDQPSVVVDPGPLDARHLDELVRSAGEVRAVLLTHHHLDHSEAARALAERVGCGVRALDPAHRLGGEGLDEGDVIAVGELEIRVIATPGHTRDSLSFLVPSAEAVLTGDTVLGRGTTMVAHPDGELGAYLGSLVRLRDLAEQHVLTSIWPGHGPVVVDALPVLDHYLAHRRERLAQVREVRDALLADPSSEEEWGGSLISAIVEIVYADVDPILWGAAELSVRAQVAYLDRG